MNISQTLKQARKAAGLTQSQLAEKVGISYGAIVNYENGRRTNISAEILFAIGDALNVPAQSFFDALNDNQPTEDQALHDLIRIYNRLNDIGQQRILDYANDIMRINEYRK